MASDEPGEMGNLFFWEGRTMRNLMWAALATSFLLAGVGVAAADDTVRLGGPSAQAAIQGGTDTLVRGGRGHGYYGGGYYRPYYGYSYYRPYYAYPRTYSYYAPAYYTPYYAPTYYYTPAYYPPVYRPAYYRPISGEAVPPPVQQTGVNYQQPPSNGNGTFPYDGGPRYLIPMPGPADETNPASKPGGTIPLDGKLVSLPTKASGGTSQINIPAARTTTTTRVSYPAYGEEPITPAPRKTNR